MRNCISHFRRIFGEQIGFYFYFLNHLHFWLLIMLFFSLIFYILSCIPRFNYSKFLNIKTNDLFDYIYTSIFFIWSIFISLKTVTLYIRSWRSSEKVKSVRWGVKEIFLIEPDRSQFICDDKISIISTTIPTRSNSSVIIAYSMSFLLTTAMVIKVLI